MDERRRQQREQRLKEELEQYRRENPKITEQFRDLKRQLKEVSYEEWDAIPAIGDYTIKKQKHFDSYTPGSDSLLARAAMQSKPSTAEVCTLQINRRLHNRAYCAALASRAGASSTNLLSFPVLARVQVGGMSGIETPAGAGLQDLTSIGAGKKTMLALNLDRMGDDGA